MTDGPSLSFAHLNLRRNPFGEFTADERARLACVDLNPAFQHLDRTNSAGLRSAVQFTGDKGHGKTTHLLAMTTRLPGAAYVYLPEDKQVAVPDHGDPLLVDEAQRLSLWQWLRLLKSRRTLILGTHTDFSLLLSAFGLSVLTLKASRLTTPEHVHRILNARIRAVQRSDGPVPVVTLETTARLLQKFGPDLRSLQHLLYDTFQELRSIQDVQV